MSEGIPFSVSNDATSDNVHPSNPRLTEGLHLAVNSRRPAEETGHVPRLRSSPASLNSSPTRNQASRVDTFLPRLL